MTRLPHRIALTADGYGACPDDDDDLDAALFLSPDGMTDAQRAWLVEILRNGATIMIAARTENELRAAMDQIGLNLVPPAGHA